MKKNTNNLFSFLLYVSVFLWILISPCYAVQGQVPTISVSSQEIATIEKSFSLEKDQDNLEHLLYLANESQDIYYSYKKDDAWVFPIAAVSSISGPGQISSPYITINSQGDIYMFWYEKNSKELRCSVYSNNKIGKTFSVCKINNLLKYEVAINDQGNILVFYQNDSNLFLLKSLNGDIYLPAQKINKTALNPDVLFDLDVSQDTVNLIYSSIDPNKTNNLIQNVSYNYGIQWEEKKIHKASNSITAVSAFTDNEQTFQLFWAENDNNRNEIFTCQQNSSTLAFNEPSPILLNPFMDKINAIDAINRDTFSQITFQVNMGKFQETYLLKSLDNGKNWNKPQSLNLNQQNLSYYLTEVDRLFTLNRLNDNFQISTSALQNNPPTFADWDTNISYSTSDEAVISLDFAHDPENDPLEYFIEISTTQDFSEKISFSNIKDYDLFVTENDNYIFSAPKDIQPGEYYIRNYCYDGINKSPYNNFTNPIKINIDSTEPFFKATNLENNWYKQGSTIALSFAVNDIKNELTEDTEFSILHNKTTCSSFIYHDEETKTLNGFVELPEILSKGKNILSLVATDKHLNIETTFEVQIDNECPNIILTANKIHCNNNRELTISATDEGSGLDESSSSITLYDQSTTIEGKVKIVDGTLVFSSSFPLKDGQYSAQIQPADKAGNIGNIINCSLIIDTIAPDLSITSQEVNSLTKKYWLEGKVDDPSIEHVTISINEKTPYKVYLSNGLFEQTIPIEKDKNNIRVCVADAAGNITEKSINYEIEQQSTGMNINTLLNYPNPYNPNTGTGKITYYLSKDAQINLYIYSLTGELVWFQRIAQGTNPGGVSGYNELPFSGKDATGRILGNGVYVYFVCADDLNGNTARARSKIIILK